MTITINLEQDLRDFIMAEMPYDKSSPSDISELNGMDISKLTIIFHNWCNRLVSNKNRTVHQSKEFQSNPLTSKFNVAVKEVIHNIQNGISLTPRLSRQVAVYGYIESSSSKKFDKDLMLNDWGVHHLHLGTGPYSQDPRFIDRTDELMFVFFKSTEAYIIDIMPHGSWTSEHIVRTAIKNWPSADLFPELKGVLPSSTSITERERAQLRKSHVATPIDIDGRVYMAPGIISTAGISFYSVRATDQLLQDLRLFEKNCLTDPDSIKSLFENNGVQWPSNPVFKFTLFDNGYGVTEINTNFRIGLSIS